MFKPFMRNRFYYIFKGNLLYFILSKPEIAVKVTSGERFFIMNKNLLGFIDSKWHNRSVSIILKPFMRKRIRLLV